MVSPELEALRDQISLKLTQISETESQLYALRQSAKILGKHCPPT